MLLTSWIFLSERVDCAGSPAERGAAEPPPGDRLVELESQAVEASARAVETSAARTAQQKAAARRTVDLRSIGRFAAHHPWIALMAVLVSFWLTTCDDARGECPPRPDWLIAISKTSSK